MVCIFCQGPTSVTNSRPQERSNHVWRRRQCQNCSKTFTTHESAILDKAIDYIDQTGAKQPFVQEVLFLSLHRSLQHRTTATTDAAALCQTVLGRLTPLVKNGQIKRADIITVASQVLKRFDRPAAVSYLAFHRPG